jgi:3-deoxy-7-phosphoheptulonate synthase
MVIVLKHGIKPEDKEYVRSLLEKRGYRIKEIVGEEETIFGAVGVVANIDVREVEMLPGVSKVIPITKPYKLASREFKKEDTIIPIGPIRIGGKRIVVIAGPCAIESRSQILEIAHCVKEAGAVILRGGAFKPRTSPYMFQGLGEEGLKYLKEAGEAVGMPVITEIVSTDHVELMRDYADILQVGARNMQNFELLKKLGKIGKPILLKRGFAATIQELLMSAEYLLAHGADNIILCERGIRTFETATRNTLDVSAIPVIKELSHLPVVVDPSHATGRREKVSSMALASIAGGADGLEIEVHTDPDRALSDGPQSLYPEQFEKLMRDIEALAPVLGKEIARLPEKSLHVSIKDKVIKSDKPGKLIISFAGEHGAFAEKAVYSYFDEEITAVPCLEFQDVFKSVLEGKSDFGLVPLENSLAGSVHQNYDLMLQFPDINIVGEKKIRVVHNLIVIPGATMEDIKRVYSHSQGLSQCSEFLEKHPTWEKIAFYNTAGAVAHIAKIGSKENASIASEEAAKVNKMQILKESIETNAQNYTRFAIIAREAAVEVEKPDKASIVFALMDKPGALFRVLKALADNNLNMTKLESRPIQGKPWEYMFYVDMALPEDPSPFDKAVKQMMDETEEFRVLGKYKKHRE